MTWRFRLAAPVTGRRLYDRSIVLLYAIWGYLCAGALEQKSVAYMREKKLHLLGAVVNLNSKTRVRGCANPFLSVRTPEANVTNTAW